MLQLALGINKAHYCDGHYEVAIILTNRTSACADLSNSAAAVLATRRWRG